MMEITTIIVASMAYVVRTVSSATTATHRPVFDEDAPTPSGLFKHYILNGLDCGRQFMFSCLSPQIRGNVDFVLLFLFCICFGLLYVLGVILYRLYLHPLAAYPGPRLAACTDWYEFYLNVFLDGQATHRRKDWHQRYGLFDPIILQV